MGFAATGKTPPRDCDLAGHFGHGGRHFGYTHRRYAADLSSALSRYQLDFLRLGSAAYFTLITTFVFAPYFATHVASDPASGQALWGFATAAAGLTIAAMSPVLGAIADASGRRKPWIAAFGALLVIGSCLMWFGKPGDVSVIPPLLLAYGVATVGAEFATVFNNAMMPSLVPPDQIGRLSGTGWATGYVGGILSLILVLGFLAASPDTGRTLFGFA